MNRFKDRLASDLPLLTAEHLSVLAGRDITARDVELAEHPAFKALRSNLAPKMELRGDLAVVPVEGVLAYRPDPFEMLFEGVEDSRNVLSMIEQARDNHDVKGVLLRMDTPGGMMLGGPEIASAVASLRKSKPCVAHIGGIGASLGYMIASQANEVIANQSAIVGSIGVIASVPDYTALLDRMGIKIETFTNKDAKYKAAGAIGTSLTDDQRANIQSVVESAFSVFRSTVLSARPQVMREAMQGQTFRGSEGKAFGLVDRVGGEEFALAVLRNLLSNGKQER